MEFQSDFISPAPLNSVVYWWQQHQSILWNKYILKRWWNENKIEKERRWREMVIERAIKYVMKYVNWICSIQHQQYSTSNTETYIFHILEIKWLNDVMCEVQKRPISNGKIEMAKEMICDSIFLQSKGKFSRKKPVSKHLLHWDYYYYYILYRRHSKIFVVRLCRQITCTQKRERIKLDCKLLCWIRTKTVSM